MSVYFPHTGYPWKMVIFQHSIVNYMTYYYLIISFHNLVKVENINLLTFNMYWYYILASHTFCIHLGTCITLEVHIFRLLLFIDIVVMIIYHFNTNNNNNDNKNDDLQLEQASSVSSLPSLQSRCKSQTNCWGIYTIASLHLNPSLCNSVVSADKHKLRTINSHRPTFRFFHTFTWYSTMLASKRQYTVFPGNFVIPGPMLLYFTTSIASIW